MRELARWGLVGYGNIGGELARQIEADKSHRLGLQPLPELIQRSGDVMAWDGVTPLGVESLLELDRLPIDAMFFALPSTDDGEPAHRLITHCLALGVQVVTCEKGSIAKDPKLLWDDRVGSSGACGGGSGIIAESRQFATAYDLNEMHCVVNGTCAAISHMADSRNGMGMSNTDAVARAVELGLAEPGSVSWLDVLRAEAGGDFTKKASTLFNAHGLGKQFIDHRDLRFSLSDGEIERVLDEGRRLIVSYYPLRNRGSFQEPRPDEILSGFDVERDGWWLVGGFREFGRTAILSVLENLQGPENGFVAGLGRNNENGVYHLTGPGAGAGPTVSAMLRDWQRLRQGRRSPQRIPEKSKPKMRVCTFSLEDILSGRIDERALDENTFYAVVNWLTGWEPVWSSIALNSEHGGDPVAEMFERADALSARGVKHRMTPGQTTVGRGELTIRHADDHFTGWTLWAVRDQELHNRYDGPQAIDIWWGLTRSNTQAAA